MRTVTVTFDVFCVLSPSKTSNVIRHYTDTPSAIRDILHDWLYLFFKCNETDIGFVTLSIKNDEGREYPTRIMNGIRESILRVMDTGVGNIPMTRLQQMVLMNTLESVGPKKQ